MKPSKLSPMDQRVFITGGASGLGRALAARWRQEGARVCIADMNVERGEATAQELGCTFVQLDVRKPEELEAAAQKLVQEWGGVDVVVNNAGVASAGKFEELHLAEWKRVVDINLLGVLHGCKAFVPVLQRQKSGTIINVSSLAGLMNLPNMATYNVTKAAVIALSETLRGELAPQGIQVSVVCPSFFKTNLAESLAKDAAPDVVASTTKLVARSRITAESIAAKVYKQVRSGEFLVLTHGDGTFAWLMKRFTPYAIFGRLVDAASKRVAPVQAPGLASSPTTPSTSTSSSAAEVAS